MKNTPCALIMAGGTGGHIFPALALARALRSQGWRVHWLGAPQSMESRLIPPHGFPLELVQFSGVRGKGWRSLVSLPLRLIRAFWQSRSVMARVQPDVLIGFGGYITLPAGLIGAMLGKPLLLHEQNSVAGMANRVLARFARRVFTAFPNAFPHGEWIGNPLRQEFLTQAPPADRYAQRQALPDAHRLRVLVVGGSLGAQALNNIVPQALALIPAEKRPIVTHQSGEKQLATLQANYAAAGVEATLVSFIDNTAQAFADADWVICRAGASTVTELLAVGTAAAFVPFPAAVDDHQTHNARFVTDAGGGWLLPQRELTPEKLADLLQNTERTALLERAFKAQNIAKIQATELLAAACQSMVFTHSK